LEIGFPAIQAALSGYSDWPMRTIARRLGAAYTLSEVMLDRFVLQVSKGRQVRRFLYVTDEDHPCGAQLLGNSAEQLVPAALQVVALGFDAVELNFACPVRKVRGRHQGGFLLRTPEIALELVARVRDALPPRVPLTLKLRRGWNDSPESREAFFALFEGAWRRGVAAVTIHGRTVQQQYSGASCWEFLGEAKRLAGAHTVLGSGDLFTPQDCFRMLEHTGVNGVAIARGALGNPWIFSQLRALVAGQDPTTPNVTAQAEVIAEHYRLAADFFGERRAWRRMRNFGIRYSRLHPQATEVRTAFIAVRSSQEWWEVLRNWYGYPRRVFL
jgi:nifR3 family TIM-barrel protein